MPKDLPSTFRLPNKFGPAIDKKLKSQHPGSMPSELVRRIIRQVEVHVSAFNPKPSPSIIEWIAKELCTKYKCLNQIDPRSVMPGYDEDASSDFKGWYLLKKQLLKKFENSRMATKKLVSDDDGTPYRKKMKLSLKVNKGKNTCNHLHVIVQDRHGYKMTNLILSSSATTQQNVNLRPIY
ncbi:uncharacterized protein LOC125561383 [Nematostella vectensis]|uniref:uncharacterized protein LOC125561383 n=1 Tax=Nematostella vectensis TaxID=45351 RepID=UPI00207771E8|nr:uncharacterized protein LOC125561383 [Nematostella vectensis]